jgi:hypothetical protein
MAEGVGNSRGLLPKPTLILMGDWCGEENTNTTTQRNYGNGTEALNRSA